MMKVSFQQLCYKIPERGIKVIRCEKKRERGQHTDPPEEK